MEVAYALLADSANASADGKLNILGAFDLVRAKSFPAFHASCTLALSIRVEHEDQQREHPIALAMVDEDFKEFWRIEGKVTVGKVEPSRISRVIQCSGTPRWEKVTLDELCALQPEDITTEKAEELFSFTAAGRGHHARPRSQSDDDATAI